jgi:hypothetical protein
LKLAAVLPASYCVLALIAWIDFARLPPDGLANIGLMLVVLPVTLLDLALRPADAPGSSVLMPDGLGYIGNHAVFFAGGVLVIAIGLWRLGRWLDRRRRARRSSGE